MHRSQSPLYGETLTRYTRAVYPSRFVLTMLSCGASVFYRIWLGHMYMESKGFPMHSSRSLIYGETLACYTHAVYSPRFLLTMPSWGASVFHRI
jgi:hypothetical protein